MFNHNLVTDGSEIGLRLSLAQAQARVRRSWPFGRVCRFQLCPNEMDLDGKSLQPEYSDETGVVFPANDNDLGIAPSRTRRKGLGNEAISVFADKLVDHAGRPTWVVDRRGHTWRLTDLSTPTIGDDEGAGHVRSRRAPGSHHRASVNTGHPNGTGPSDPTHATHVE